MDDINKYAKIWDDALEKGIFKDAPKPAQPRNRDAEDFGTDFFGQSLYDYDPNEPLNECDTKYWAKVSRMADHSGQYVDPLTEESNPSKAEMKTSSEKMAGSHNPIYPNSVGVDQEVKPTQNWGVGGKEHFALEDLKIRLERLEGKLNALEATGKPAGDTQSKIDGIKKQIDELSDTLSGNRFSDDG